MAGTVGGINCDFVHGAGRENVERVDFYQVPGVGGYGAQLLGKGDAPFRFEVVKFDTLANLLTWIGNIRAKVGIEITIIDDWGTSHPDCLIARPGIPRLSPNVDTTKIRCGIFLEGVYTPGT